MGIPIDPSSSRASALVSASLLALLSGACDGDTRRPPETLKTADGTTYVANELILRRNPEVTEAAFEGAIARLGATILDRGGGVMGELGYVRVRLPANLSPDQAAVSLSEDNVTLEAERNYLVQHWKTPNDPNYAQLWGMAKISAPAAWDVTTGGSGVLVAVSDTGVDCTHPDLAPNCWTNPNEIAGNGIDDDNNGFVDDTRGWDFANNDNNPADDGSHGTHVAGTIGAAGNDGKGVVGVSWSPKIVGVKFLGANGGTLWNGAQTVSYAAKIGARVVNASWGCLGASCYASYMVDALNALNAKGGVFIAAAGNNNRNNNDVSPTYPANYANPNVIAVAATDSNDNLASFTNIGATKVHLAAPGVGVLSSVPGGGYASYNGTSMAAPHVAGAAALYFALRPTATVAELKTNLLASVDKIAGLNGMVASGGRLNVHRLLTTDTQAPAAPTNLKGTPGKAGEVTLTWSPVAADDLAAYRVRWGVAAGQYASSQDVGKATTSTTITNLADGGTFFFVVQAVDGSGNWSPNSADVKVEPQDLLAPPAVADLRATNIAGEPVDTQVVAASGASSAFWEANRAIDGNLSTAWLAPPRMVAQEEFLVLSLQPSTVIDRVDLVANAAYPEFFPVDFDIDVSSDATVWTTIGGRRGAQLGTGETMTVAFPPATASYVRLRVHKSMKRDSGLYYTSIAEMTVREIAMASGAVAITFTAPGDDPGAGKAASYDLRWASTPITDANFAAATAVPTPGPNAAGIWEMITVDRLARETVLYFAIKAIDDGGNVAPLSNVAVLQTTVVPPAPITDLVAVAAAMDSVELRWRATGADGHEGRAASYELRRSTSQITPANFTLAELVKGVPAPQAAGMPESFQVKGLQDPQLHYFAIRAIDEGGAPGPISNVASAMPGTGPDNKRPATVESLAAALSQAEWKLKPTIHSSSDSLPGTGTERLFDGNIDTAWVGKQVDKSVSEFVVFDLGAAQALTRLRMNPGLRSNTIVNFPQGFVLEVSADRVNWQEAMEAEAIQPRVGAWEEWRFEPITARYVRLRVTTPAAGFTNTTYKQSGVGEMELWALTPAFDVDITWISSGDDGFEGNAVRYELRRSTSPITEQNFAAATLVQAGTPLPSGLVEAVLLTDLPFEEIHHFAVKICDEQSNCSTVSNVVRIETPGVPPGPVADLRVTGSTQTTISLAFTASGDNGNIGRATAYELRIHDKPITHANWTDARGVPTPDPSDPGTTETVTVTGLAPNTSYWFAVRVIDDRAARSILSNTVEGTTLDGIAPAAITDLVVARVDPATLPALAVTVTESTGSYSGATAATMLLDATASTPYISPVRGSPTEESVRFALGGSKRISRLRMRAATAYEDLFPAGFRVEVRKEANGAWVPVVDEASFVVNGGAWEEWSLGAPSAVEVRLVVTASRRWAGGYVAAIGDLELYEDTTETSRLRLTWTATGDDGRVGTASRYDLRRGSIAIEEASFGSAITVTAPSPRVAGSLERAEVAGLAPETIYCFAVKAIDDMNLTGPISNSPCAETAGLPPSTIGDLRVVSVTTNSVTLAWTAPGGDADKGQASAYELRRSGARIHGGNWTAATAVIGLPTPKVAGSAETFTVMGLAGTTTYHFALRAVDAAGNIAAPSNNARGTTEDDVPPGKVVNLTAATAAINGAIEVAFTAPGDNGATGKATRYDVRASLAPITEANFASSPSVPSPTPQSGGALERFAIAGYAGETVVYVALKAIDAIGNVSPMSNVASASTRNEPPAAITDLSLVSARGSGQVVVQLAWTAPGDDGRIGTATSYRLAMSTAPITDTNFDNAEQLGGLPTPGAPGTREVYSLNRPPGRRYYFAVKTRDERNNEAPISNLLVVDTPDETAPRTIGDLRAATGTAAGTVVITWTAPGDDDNEGTARSYELRYAGAPFEASGFDAATSAPVQPVPAAAGTVQSFTVSGLANETHLYFRMRAIDDVGNKAGVSNQADARTPDVAPAAIANLAQTARTATSVTLKWSATGDDGVVGTAAAYEMRWSASALNAGNFAAGTLITTGTPKASGSEESATITGLTSTKIYYVAIRARDERQNWSPLSNLATAETADELPPGRITDLAARTGTSAGTIILNWTATGDDGSTGRAARYELRRSASAITDANWSSATIVAGPPLPGVSGAAETFTVTGLAGETKHHFAIRAIDEANNAGDVSNSASADTLPVAPAGVTDLRATVAPGGLVVTLTWTAPGDDGVRLRK